MNKALALLLCAVLPAAASAVQPDVEPLTLNPQNQLYCNEQADWCVGIKVDGGLEDNGPFATKMCIGDSGRTAQSKKARLARGGWRLHLTIPLAAFAV